MEKPNYCSNSGVSSCLECSFVNYGRDCQNNLIFTGKTGEMTVNYDALEDLYHGIENVRRLVGFLADHSGDEQIMGSLTVAEEKLESIENKLHEILGYVPGGKQIDPSIFQDVPFD